MPKVNMVVMGAGMDLKSRLEIARHIFQARTSTSVHMKDEDSGLEGFCH